MAVNPVRLHELFLCGLAETHLAAVPPPVAVRPAAWKRTYRVLTVGGKGLGAAGSIVLERQPAAGAIRVGVAYDKLLPGGFTHFCRIDAACEDAPLLSPISWTIEARSADGQGTPDPLTETRQEARVSPGTALIRSFGKDRRVVLGEGPFTAFWTLFAAIGSLPREAFPPTRFLLLDDMDQPKPGALLTFAGSRRVTVGGNRRVVETEVVLERGRVFQPRVAWVGGDEMELARYNLTGPGIVPMVFYADSAGRVVFASAGTRAYSLEQDALLEA